ncbi:MAG TPA: hypothetical protein VFH54_02245 [Mycobacteriales bacterium]|nr:hypothetical protein [Mycobacteriales bacterium]
MTGLRDALQDAAQHSQPAPTFDVAAALGRGRRRRQRRIAATVAVTALATTGMVVGVTGSLGEGGGRSTVVTSTPPPSPARSQQPVTTVTPPPAKADGPPCGTVGRQLAATARRTLPHIGTWGPVAAAPGMCTSDSHSFDVTIHIGNKIGWLSVVVWPTQRQQCPTKTHHGGTITCRALPEGDLIAYDKLAGPTYGGTSVQQAEVILMLKNGFTIDANTLGGPDHWPAAGIPNGAEPYTASDLTQLAVALAHTSQVSGLQPAPFHTTS